MCELKKRKRLNQQEGPGLGGKERKPKPVEEEKPYREWRVGKYKISLKAERKKINWRHWNIKLLIKWRKWLDKKWCKEKENRNRPERKSKHGKGFLEN